MRPPFPSAGLTKFSHATLASIVSTFLAASIFVALQPEVSSLKSGTASRSPAANEGKFTARIPGAETYEVYTPANPALAFDWGLTPASGPLSLQSAPILAEGAFPHADHNQAVATPLKQTAPAKRNVTLTMLPPRRPLLQDSAPVQEVAASDSIPRPEALIPEAQINDENAAPGLWSKSRHALAQAAAVTDGVWTRLVPRL